MMSSDNPSMDPEKKRKRKEKAVLAEFPATTEVSHEDLRKIIEPFTHEQLSQIVQTASLSHPDVLDAVRSIADRDPTQRKLFVRYLSSETTTEKLRELFSTYGELIEAIVILDKVTGKSRGYGFVTYKHIDSALIALKEPNKNIDGRTTVTTLASAGFTNGGLATANSQTPSVSSRKIYVSNVPIEMSKERLLAHFSSYGEIDQGPLGFDKVTGKSRGYALFIYRNVEGLRASLVDPNKIIDGHQLTCKIANDSKIDKVDGVAAQGLGNGGKPEVLNSNQQSSMQRSFTSQYGGVSGGLGLPGGSGGISGYGGGGKIPPSLVQSHSQHPMNLNLGTGSGLSSFVSNGGGLGLSTNRGQPPSSLGGGGFSGGYGGGPGLSTNGVQAPSSLGGGGGGGFSGGYGGGQMLSTDVGQPPSSLGGGSGRFSGGYGGGPGLTNVVQASSSLGGVSGGFSGSGPGLSMNRVQAPNSLGGGSGGFGGGLGLSMNGVQASSSVGGGTGVFSGGYGGGSGLLTNGVQAPNSLGGSSGGRFSGGGQGLLTNGAQAPSFVGGSSGGGYVGSHIGGPSASYGAMGSGGGAGIGGGFGGSGQKLHHGLPPSSLRMSSGESAHYSLSSGSSSLPRIGGAYQGTLHK